MGAPYNTLLLDRTTWDLVVDIDGNIAMAKPPYALAQDAASAARLFNGELWYDTTQGMPYWQQVLGKFPPINLLKQFYVAAAQSVPGVMAAVCYISGIVGRAVSGQLQLTDTNGNITTSGF